MKKNKSKRKLSSGKKSVTFWKIKDYIEDAEHSEEDPSVFWYSPQELKDFEEEQLDLKERAAELEKDRTVCLRGCIDTINKDDVKMLVKKIVELQEELQRMDAGDPEGLRSLSLALTASANEESQKRAKKDSIEAKKVYNAMKREAKKKLDNLPQDGKAVGDKMSAEMSVLESSTCSRARARVREKIQKRREEKEKSDHVRSDHLLPDMDTEEPDEVELFPSVAVEEKPLTMEERIAEQKRKEEQRKEEEEQLRRERVAKEMKRKEREKEKAEKKKRRKEEKKREKARLLQEKIEREEEMRRYEEETRRIEIEQQRLKEEAEQKERERKERRRKERQQGAAKKPRASKKNMAKSSSFFEKAGFQFGSSRTFDKTFDKSSETGTASTELISSVTSSGSKRGKMSLASMGKSIRKSFDSLAGVNKSSDRSGDRDGYRDSDSSEKHKKKKFFGKAIRSGFKKLGGGRSKSRDRDHRSNDRYEDRSREKSRDRSREESRHRSSDKSEERYHDGDKRFDRATSGNRRGKMSLASMGQSIRNSFGTMGEVGSKSRDKRNGRSKKHRGERIKKSVAAVGSGVKHLGHEVANKIKETKHIGEGVANRINPNRRGRHHDDHEHSRSRHSRHSRHGERLD